MQSLVLATMELRIIGTRLSAERMGNHASGFQNMSGRLLSRIWGSGWLQGLVLICVWLLVWAFGILAEYTYHASIWFPPAGLTFAALLVIGWRAVPFIFVAAIISTFWSVELYSIESRWPKTLLAGIKFGFAHILVYAAGASVLRLIARRGQDRLPVIIIGFLIVSAVFSLLATAMVLLMLVSGGLMEFASIADSWFAFWVGDMVALIVLAPLFASMLFKLYARPVFRIVTLELVSQKNSLRQFVFKLFFTAAFVTLLMLITQQIDTLESAFLIFFLIIPQMWLTFSENTFRTVASLAILSFLMVLLVYILGLGDYAFVYQFAIAMVATTSYFGVAIPLLALDNERLRKQVMLDGLTGAASRDFLVQQVELEIQRSVRGDRAMCLLVIDIDHFKQINDRFGHGQGDEALIQLTTAIKRELRGTDVLARFGGDEFVTLLPDTDLERAQAIAQRVQVQVRALRIQPDYIMTTSIGIAEFRPDDLFSTLFTRADQALYEAKAAGRDRVRSAVAV